MEHFQKGFEKRAFNLSDAKKVFNASKQNLIRRYGVSGAYEGAHMNREVGRIFVKGQQSFNKSLKMEPAQQKMRNLMTIAHEADEFHYKDLPRYRGYSSHGSPDVLLRESNRVATLPKSMEPIKQEYVGTRARSGEAGDISAAAPGFEYGKTRLSRHGRKHVVRLMQEKGFSRDMPALLEQRGANIDKFHPINLVNAHISEGKYNSPLKEKHIDIIAEKSPKNLYHVANHEGFADRHIDIVAKHTPEKLSSTVPGSRLKGEHLDIVAEHSPHDLKYFVDHPKFEERHLDSVLKHDPKSIGYSRDSAHLKLFKKKHLDIIAKHDPKTLRYHHGNPEISEHHIDTVAKHDPASLYEFAASPHFTQKHRDIMFDFNPEQALSNIRYKDYKKKHIDLLAKHAPEYLKHVQNNPEFDATHRAIMNGLNKTASYAIKGFEKEAEANGLIGSMPNLASGTRAYSHGGTIKPPKPPKPGIVQAPRSDMPELGTMAGHSDTHNLDPILPAARAEKIRIPKVIRKGM